MFTRNAALAGSRLLASLPRTATALRTTFSRRPEILLRPLRQQRYAGKYQRFPGQNSGGPEWTRFGPFARANYIVRNNPKTVMVVVGAGGTFYVVNLEQVPITGRRRFNLLSPETEKEMAGDYNDILRQFQGKVLPEKHPYTQLVAKVVERLLPSTGGLAGDEWRVFVIDDPKQMNAFVVPGGKVFVFSGILPIAQDEAGLAAVLGHEIAHNVAHHVAEKISGSLIWTALTFGGSLVLGIDQSITNSITQLALALPNSRTMEEEADHIGLLMMAESCYDPTAAVGLWQRMHDAEKGAPPQFLSTHPSSLGRMERIKGWLPQAEERYSNSQCGNISEYAEDFRRKIGQSSTPQVAIGPSRSSKKDDDFF
jgi:predicted Zn-dependent protease